MRAAGKTYLPQEPKESNDAYAIRLSRSFLFNGFGQTVQDMTGKVFAKPVLISDDMPPELTAMAENIDLEGRNLDTFAVDVFSKGLVDGIAYMLVDMDPVQTDDAGNPITLTRADEIAMKRRPWLVQINAEQVLGWRSEVISGARVLTQFRFMESVTEADGEFADKPVKQVKVFTRDGSRVIWQTYRQSVGTASAEWVPFDGGLITLPEIPVVPVYLKRDGFMCGSPVLADLAEVNLAHWQSQSDQRNILHIARVPILFGSGWSDDGGSLEIGAARMLIESSENATLQFVEHSGASIGAGREDLKDLEFQMQTLGLELLIPRPGGQSATGAAIDQARMNTPLAMMANALKDALEQAFRLMAAYSGLDASKAALAVNTDFGISLRGAQDATTLIALASAGILSRATVIAELKRRAILRDDLDAETELLAVAGEAMDPIDDQTA